MNEGGGRTKKKGGRQEPGEGEKRVDRLLAEKIRLDPKRGRRREKVEVKN